MSRVLYNIYCMVGNTHEVLLTSNWISREKKIVSIYVILIAGVHLLYKARYCNIGLAPITLLSLIVLD